MRPAEPVQARVRMHSTEADRGGQTPPAESALALAARVQSA